MAAKFEVTRAVVRRDRGLGGHGGVESVAEGGTSHELRPNGLLEKLRSHGAMLPE